MGRRQPEKELQEEDGKQPPSRAVLMNPAKGNLTELSPVLIPNLLLSV